MIQIVFFITMQTKYLSQFLWKDLRYLRDQDCSKMTNLLDLLVRRQIQHFDDDDGVEAYMLNDSCIKSKKPRRSLKNICLKNHGLCGLRIKSKKPERSLRNICPMKKL